MSLARLPRLALIGLLAGTLVWALWSQRQELSLGAGPAPLAPDYFVLGADSRSYGADGRLQRRLQAERLDHLPQFASTEMVAPQVTLHLADGGRWQAQAEAGNHLDSGAQILLKGRFNLNNAPSLAAPLSLSGESLRIFPQHDYAETDAALTVSGKHSVLTGVGGQLWFSSQRLRLLSAVSGHHDNP